MQRRKRQNTKTKGKILLVKIRSKKYKKTKILLVKIRNKKYGKIVLVKYEIRITDIQKTKKDTSRQH